MNKKLLRSLISITSMVGIVTPIPFTVSACWTSEEPIELKCNDETIPGDITGDINTSIAATASLSGHIETNTGESVSDVTFTCEGLKEQTGLDINETTGVISGTLTKKPTNPEFKIKFTANVHSKQLEGYTNTFTITINPTELECDTDTIPGNITGNVGTPITATEPLSGHIKTDAGESVDDVTFTCTGLPSGLIINKTTGVITGNPTEETNSQQFIITFTALIDGMKLTGQIDKFTTSIGPKLPSSLTSDVSVYDEIRSTTINVATQELKGHIKTDTDVTVNKKDHELRFTISEGTLPTGLSFNDETGVISGKCETIGIYKFKITANATVCGVNLSYQTEEFTITISNTILPDIVYKYSDTKKTILTGFTDEFLTNPNTYNMCDTMQIVRNVVSIDTKSFFKLGGGSTIPSFITKLTFAEGSSCSSIGDSAFEECWSFTSITLPNSIVSIGSYAFLACVGLETLDLSRCANLTSINKVAFENCIALTTIHWNLPTNYSTTITISNDRTFQDVPTSGTFKCSTSGVNLNDLKTWLEGKGFPTGWTFTQ